MSKIIFVAVFLTLFRDKVDRALNTRFKSVKCYVLDEELLAMNYCKVKVYSRSLSSLNIGVTLHKQVNKPIFVRTLTFIFT